MPSYAIFYFYVRRAEFDLLYLTGKAERQGFSETQRTGLSCFGLAAKAKAKKIANLADSLTAALRRVADGISH